MSRLFDTAFEDHDCEVKVHMDCLYPSGYSKRRRKFDEIVFLRRGAGKHILNVLQQAR